MIHETFSHIFDSPWSKVSFAFWRKYPHPSRSDLLSIDVIDKKFDGRILTITRLVTGEMSLPPFLKTWTSPVCYVLETIIVDVTKQRMDIQTRNITFSGMVDVVEDCSYYAYTSQSTVLDQVVTINTNLRFIGNQVEHWIFDNFKEKVDNGRKIMNDLI